MKDTLTTLSDYICNVLIKQPGRSLSAADVLLTSGLIDSFHLVDLATFVEDTFGVLIADYELTPATFDTLGQLVELIETRQAQ